MGDDGARVAVKKSGPVVRLKNGKFKIDLADDHRQLLTQLIEQLRDSLTTTTDDSNLRRLFPTAYHNDAKKDAEYQRLMRDELLESRLAAIDIAISVLATDDEITGEQIDSFSRSINSFLHLTRLRTGEGEFTHIYSVASEFGNFIVRLARANQCPTNGSVAIVQA
ncbi:MAG: DUF2017 family protein [Actinobacteria bacterium]|nr:DUF2017 family protein [Actinomycetota bacterium]